MGGVIYPEPHRMETDKEALKERLRKQLAEAKAERERKEAAGAVHPATCKCRGHGTLPMGQFLSGRSGTEFGCGYVKCDVAW